MVSRRKLQLTISRIKLIQLLVTNQDHSLSHKAIALKVINRTLIHRAKISRVREIATRRVVIARRAVKGNEVSREKQITLTEQVMAIVQIMVAAREMATMQDRANQKEAVTEIRVVDVNSLSSILLVL